MGENAASKNHHLHSHHQVFDIAIDVLPQNGSKCFDDDGRLKRTGTLFTASAHIITAVIGSGVLSLAWAIAQLGWVAGPAVMVLFSLVTYYTSSLLTDCYRAGDPDTGKRNYTYMDAVRSILGGVKVKFCGFIQYLGLFGIAIGYTIASSISMMAIKRSQTLISYGGSLSLPQSCLFTYSSIGLGLGIGKVAANGTFKGSLTGISIGTVTETEKIWRSFQALGAIAFAYSYSVILIEIQDTVKSPPSESKTMKKAASISTVVTTTFYMLCGCMGYAAFGDLAPGNLLTGFGFYNPYWLIDIANVAIVIHLKVTFITKEFKIAVPGLGTYKLNLFRLVWRTLFVILTTVISMLLPFFNDVVGILGALGFWPLTVYFPVEMYIVQKKIPKWSTRWICLQMLSMACLVISLVAVAGSIAGVVLDLKSYKPFKTSY
ncbi:hypothetical protein OIU84_029469 [Salix udensis]|uniref:Amino acid transporter transmembrane domain-containing protein n=1 Tax=Salix udensis TaxID=889485 RepID=A0AAD6K9F1_9ROSI|nr:hypothetical protein OIU84_029469 [Salix udensis]